MIGIESMPSLLQSPLPSRRRCNGGRTFGSIRIDDKIWIRLAVAVAIGIVLASSSYTVCGWSPTITVARGGVGFPLRTPLLPIVTVKSPFSSVECAFSCYSSPSSLSFMAAQDDDEIVSTIGDKRSRSSAKQRLRDQKQRKPPSIITCSSTKELVHAIDSIVTRDLVVAELGSQLREVSATIRDRASSDSVYVDVKRNFPKAPTQQTPSKGTKRISTMRLATSADKGEIENGHNNDDGATTTYDFREIDKFSDWRSAFFQSSSSLNRYDVLVLDVNAIVGNDLEWTCLDLVLEFEQMAAMVAAAATSTSTHSDDGSYGGLQYVLVKSLGLNSVASQLTYTAPWLDPKTTNHSRLCRIVASIGVHDYRQTIPGVLKLLQQAELKTKPPRDSEQGREGCDEELSLLSSSSSTDFFVLEVGSHFGTSTVLLNDVFDDVMGVDVGSKIIKEAQKKFPSVFFRTGDAWKTAGLLRLQQEYYLDKEESSRMKTASSEDGSIDTDTLSDAVPNQTTDSSSSTHQKVGFDAVYVDVGGLSGADGLLDTIALVKSIQYALEPRCIVVKSLCLQRLASRFTPYWKWKKKGNSDFN